jgi:hypothetical protein
VPGDERAPRARPDDDDVVVPRAARPPAGVDGEDRGLLRLDGERRHATEERARAESGQAKEVAARQLGGERLARIGSV